MRKVQLGDVKPGQKFSLSHACRPWLIVCWKDEHSFDVIDHNIVTDGMTVCCNLDTGSLFALMNSGFVWID